MDINQAIREHGRQIYPELVNIRHELHANPELSGREMNTVSLVERTLQSWGIPCKRSSAGTALLAEIVGGLPGRFCVGLRGDMDALPVREETDVPYRSRIPGVMHACGHDVHTALLLGAGYVLQQIRHTFAGTVKLCFQPAEETGGGFEELVGLGMLETPRVDAFLAAHVCPDTTAGRVHVKSGAVMAASSQFRAVFTGPGGHAASPHRTPDPILAVSKFVLELQTIAARLIDPLEPLVISTGSVHGGSRSNIIPESTELLGTIRTPDRRVHDRVHRLMRNALEGITHSTGVGTEITFQNGSDSVMNDPELTELFFESAQTLSDTQVSRSETMYLGSDNFYRFTQEAPSVYFRLGVRREGDRTPYALHAENFYAEDSAILTGVMAMCRGALEFLNHFQSREGSCHYEQAV